MFEIKKKYVLGIVFDSEFKEVMLLRRLKEPYKGTINGIGGKVEVGEDYTEAMRREMLEETDIKLENVSKIEPLVTSYFPDGTLLSTYYIVLNKTYIKKKQIDTVEGSLNWYDFISDKLYDVRKAKVAGEGNVAYFINFALTKEGKAAQND